jgi:hypothetical protein
MHLHRREEMSMRADRLGVVAVSFIALAVAGWPQPSLADVGDISVGGVWVCRITQPALGLTAEQRAVQMNRQITEALSTPRFRRGAVLSIRAQGSSATISVGDLLIVTVTPQDAKGTSVGPMELARQWAKRLATGLSKALPDTEFHTF